MKVIKDPVPVCWSIQKACIADIKKEDVGCEAVLEVDYTDIYTKHLQRFKSTDWGEGYTETFEIFAFRCPCCGNESSIKESEIPDKIRKIIRNTEKEKRLEKMKK